MKYCSSCGSDMKNNANFCKSCGQRVDELVQDYHEASEKLGLIDLYISSFRKYFDFHGRASRREYWNFYLISTAVWLFLGIIFENSETGTSLVGLFYLVTMIPTISVGVRRMHDLNKSGWYLLVPLLNLIMLLSRGDEHANEYGSIPIN